MEFLRTEVHEEFAKRMEEEHHRISKRLEAVEDNTKVLNALSQSTERLALNMEYMANEQEKQGKRLEVLEKEPLDTMKQVKYSVISTIIGGVIGAILTAVLTIL